MKPAIQRQQNHILLLWLFMIFFLLCLNPSLHAEDHPAGTPGAVQFTGAATASIGIDVPPGRSAGTTPHLALTYSSNGGDGGVGIGWSLDMGKIVREQDWGNGKFYLETNGTRTPIVKKDGQYRLEKHDGPMMSIHNGDLEWIMTATDGTKYFYGHNCCSKKYR